jgi:hypothetical protein
LRMTRIMSHNDSQTTHMRYPVALTQLTIRGFDKPLERRLRDEARAAGSSLNRAALKLMRRGAGLEQASHALGVGASLDHLIGRWSADDERAMREAVRVFERVDEGLWR